MDHNNYLIPANSKKSMLYFGLFNKVDLIVLVIGSLVSLIFFLVVQEGDLWVKLALASPFIFAVLMVSPLPYYHNVMTFIGNIYKFFSGRKKYYWRGWCASREQRNNDSGTK